MSLTSLSLLPLLADVAVEAEVVRDEVEAVDPVRVSRRDWTDERAESTEAIAVVSDVTCVDSDDFSDEEHDTELLTLEISTERV